MLATYIANMYKNTRAKVSSPEVETNWYAGRSSARREARNIPVRGNSWQCTATSKIRTGESRCSNKKQRIAVLILSNVITDFNSFHRRYHSPVRRDHADTGVSHASGILGLRGSCWRSSRIAITGEGYVLEKVDYLKYIGSWITSRPESIQPTRQNIEVCTPTQNRAAPNSWQW